MKVKIKKEDRVWKIPVGKLQMPSKCYNCGGTGYDVCPECFGNNPDCTVCGGGGLIDCPVCKGKGYE